MRYLFFLLAFAFSVPAFSQNITNFPSQHKDEFKDKVIRLDGSRMSSDPLFILNGFKASKEEMQKLDVNQIENIEILKGEKAAALYGRMGCDGVVFIRTKTVLKFIFQDMVGNQMIAGATVKLFSGELNDTLIYVADSSGFLEIKNIKHDTGYGIIVSAVGYEDWTMPFTSMGGTDEIWIRMTRKYVTCQNVVISAFGVVRCARRMCCFCGLNKKEDKEVIQLPVQTSNRNRCYPNPLPRGQSLHIEMSTNQQAPAIVRILNAGGILVRSQQVVLMEGTNRIEIPADGRMVPGTYFVIVYDAQQQPVVKQKVVIQ